MLSKVLEEQIVDEVCPKCGGAMAPGKISVSHSFAFRPDSAKFWTLSSGYIPLASASACVDCGYLEMFMDALKLKDQLARDREL